MRTFSMPYVAICTAFSLGQVLAAFGYGHAVLRPMRRSLADREPKDDEAGGAEAREAHPAGSAPPRSDRVNASRLLLILLAFGLGLVCLSLLIAIAALVGLLNRPVLAAIFAAGWALFALHARGSPYLRRASLLPPSLPPPSEPSQAPVSPARRDARRRRIPSAAVISLLVLPVALLFLECLIPDYSGDAYLYHLSAPLFYVLEGGFAPQPYAFYYHYPLLMEMLYAPALAFGAEQAALLLNFWITLAAALALYALGARVMGKAAARIPACIYLISPLTLLWSRTAQPETGATLLLILTLTALEFWREKRRMAWMALAGVLAGGLVGCKILYALFAAGIFAVLCLATLADHLPPKRRLSPEPTPTSGEGSRQAGAPRRRRTPWYAALIFLVSAAASYAPWLIKNALFTHDPFFPIAVNWFPTIPNLKAGAHVFGAMHGFPGWEGAGLWGRSALHGVSMLFGTGDLAFVWAMLCVPIAWAATMFRRRPPLGSRLFWSLLFALFLVVCHYGQILQTRWFLPAYALFGFATAWVLVGVWNGFLAHAPRLLRRAMPLLFLIPLVWAWAGGYCFALTGSDSSGVGFHRPWTGLTARSRARFLAELPGWAAAQMVNETAPPAARILVVQPPPYPQVRWYRRRFIQNGQDWFLHLQALGRTPEQITQDLRAAGVTHVLAPNGWNLPFFRRHGRALGERAGYTLFALLRTR